MDTKLKNYRYSVWFKISAILLCIAGMLTLAYGLLNAPYFDVAVQNGNLKESIAIKNILSETYNIISDITFTYKNEDYIKSGKLLDQNAINDKKSSLQNEKTNSIQQINDHYNQLLQQTASEEKNLNSITGSTSSNEENGSKSLDILKEQKNTQIEAVIQKYDALIKNVETDYINDKLSEYRNSLNELNKKTGIYYTVVVNGKATLSNSDGNSLTSEEAFYKRLPYFVQITQDNVNSVFSPVYVSPHEFTKDTVIYLGISQEKYDTELAAFKENSQKGLWGIKICSIGLLAFLFGLIYIIYASGRRVDMEGVHLLAADAVYLDAALAVSIAAIALCMTPLFEFGRYLFYDTSYYNKNLLLFFFGVLISLGTLIGILFVTILSKRLKRHEVIRHTLIFRVFTWSIGKAKSIYANIALKINSVFDKSPIAMRLVLIFTAYAFNVFIGALIFFAARSMAALFGIVWVVGISVVAIYFLLKAFKSFKDIQDGAERIRSGDLAYNIPEQGIPELNQLSATINKIADGLKGAVSSQVKAERMKAELITNVSHDLKTPLTSIITYVDLLKNEGLQSENADKYLGIIDTKSQRLKALTEDLFEAAKATSGNISVNYEKLNVVSLINQGLAELSDKIDASGLSFRTNLPSEKLYVRADGKLLWRVIENLLSNVFKYALPNSRVYIDAFAKNENVGIVIKNISAYELNIDEGELMERFKRGDASRNSEGSGLGLSIAKSLTELQGGSFSIEIDGDLFKATVVLPAV